MAYYSIVVSKVFYFVGLAEQETMYELIKLPVLEMKCKAMMGICIYWISRHVIFGKRCKSINLTLKVPWGVGNILQSLNAWWV